jgi:hypothetical protein
MAARRGTSARQSRPSRTSTRSSTPRISPSKRMKVDVALNGTMPTCRQHRDAVAAADLRGVHDLLKVIPLPGDYRTLSTAANDPLVLNLVAPDELEAMASDGNVWLTGTGPFGPQHQDAVGPAGPGGRAARCSR